MGQAKKRGTFAQRKIASQEAYEELTSTMEEAKAHLAKLSEMEALSLKQANVVAAQMIVAHWKHTNLEQRMTSSTGLVAS